MSPRAKRRDDPAGLLTQAAYARHRGVSKEAVRKAVRDGRIPAVGKRKLVDPAAADRAWASNTDTRMPSNSVTGNPKNAAPRKRGGARRADRPVAATESLARHHAERAEWTAKQARLDYERKSGVLVNGVEADQRFFKLARDARNAMIALADRLGPAMAPITDPRECTARLRAELLKLAHEISDSAGRQPEEVRRVAGR
jgi:hypothetical protein